jgi:hypothetical protein
MPLRLTGLLPQALAAALVLCVCAPTVAAASQSVRLDAGFSPNRLGAPTTISFAFAITGSGGQPPSPLMSVDLHLPAGLGLATTTLGLAVCEPQALLVNGPAGCPNNSRVGYGKATAEVPYGPEVVREEVGVNAFLGHQEGEHLTILFFAEGWEPVFAQIVFPGQILEDRGLYSGRLNTTVPLIPSVPEGPDVSVTRFRSTIGPSHITYYREIGGRMEPFKPRGATVPAHCPSGGFPFAADFAFQDGTHATARHTVACPR